MVRNPERLAALLLFVLALALRLWFVTSETGDALYWDEVHYNVTSAEFAQAWRALFDDDSAISAWHKAFAFSRQKGETYSIFAGLLYALDDFRPAAVFIAQAILDALTCFFVYLVARRLVGAKVALLTFLVAAFYEPFIFSAARLQTEAFAGFLLMAACAALLAPQRWQRTGHFSAGLLLAVGMLAKPAFKFLGLVWLPFVFYGFNSRPRPRYTNALVFALGFMTIVGPRLAVTYSFFGEASWSGDLDPGTHVYGGAIPEDGGWRTMGYQPTGELLNVLGTSTRNPTSADYWNAAVRTWLYHPAASAAVAFHKLYEAWLHPYNDSRRQFLFGPSALRFFHGLILILGVVGIPLTLRRGVVGGFLIATAAYLWANYLAVAIEVRYAVTAMPLMLCFAAVACVDLWAGWKEASTSRRIGVIVAALSVVVLGALMDVFTTGRLLTLIGGGGFSPNAAHVVRTLSALLASGVVAVAVVTLLAQVMSWRTAVLTACLPWLLSASVLIAGVTQAHEWREWSTRLVTGGSVAQLEIDVPPGTMAPVHLGLFIDVQRICDDPFDLVVRVNGREAHRFHQGLGEPKALLLNLDDFRKVLRGQHRAAETIPGWRMIPLEPEWATERRLRVELEVENGPEGAECVELFGDYQDDPKVHMGPTVYSAWRPEHSSIYRYVVSGDDRMRRRTELDARSQGRLGRGDTWSDELSGDAGIQTGRFRMFLVLTYREHRSVF